MDWTAPSDVKKFEYLFEEILVKKYKCKIIAVARKSDRFLISEKGPLKLSLRKQLRKVPIRT